MRRFFAIAAAALLIASCGDRREAGNGSAPANATADAGKPADATRARTAPAEMAALTPGEYETTIEVLRMDIVGGPRIPGGIVPPVPPPSTVRSCLTPEQARRPDAGFLTGKGAQAGCAYENLTMSDGRIQGAVTCDSQGTRVRTTMDGRFGSDSYTVESQSRIETNGMTIESAGRATSRRIGDCPAR
jgi:hypothetical protein